VCFLWRDLLCKIPDSLLFWGRNFKVVILYEVLKTRRFLKLTGRFTQTFSTWDALTCGRFSRVEQRDCRISGNGNQYILFSNNCKSTPLIMQIFVLQEQVESFVVWDWKESFFTNLHNRHLIWYLVFCVSVFLVYWSFLFTVLRSCLSFLWYPSSSAKSNGTKAGECKISISSRNRWEILSSHQLFYL